MRVDIYSDGDAAVDIKPKEKAVHIVIPMEIGFMIDLTGEQKTYITGFRGVFEIEMDIKLVNEKNLVVTRIEKPSLKNLVIQNDNVNIIDEIELFTKEFDRMLTNYTETFNKLIFENKTGLSVPEYFRIDFEYLEDHLLFLINFE